MEVGTHFLYILTRDASVSESMIIRVNLSDFAQNEIRFAGNFNKLTKRARKKFIHFIERIVL